MKEVFLTLLRPLLIPFSFLYGLIIWLRNKVYDQGIYSSIEFSVPVISVGNLSTGGTGKTPHIEYLISLLNYEYKVATMSRGYKRKTRGFQLADAQTDAAKIGDEPMQFYLKFPETIVSVCEERMTGIPELMRLHPEIEVILLDDAYQHRSVKPGLNILVMDFNKPFYEDHILPFGSLREPRSTYKRADIIIVSKCPPQLTREQSQEIVQKIQPYPHQKVYFSAIRYGTFWDFFTKQVISLSSHVKVVAVSGIAHPQSLMDYLNSLQLNVHLLNFPDHHYFRPIDLEEIKKTYENWGDSEKVLVTTEKDAVRLALHEETLRSWGIQILVLPIQVYFLFEQPAFESAIFEYIQKEQEQNNSIWT